MNLCAAIGVLPSMNPRPRAWIIESFYSVFLIVFAFMLKVEEI